MSIGDRMKLTVEKEALFWSKVDKSGECWLWTKGTFDCGYGAFWVPPQNRAAHIVSYNLLVGAVPSGLQLDHLCRVRKCVNPAHLEPVTCRENLLRGETYAAVNAAKTHCPKGHPYSADNTRITAQGLRACRTCERARLRRTYVCDMCGMEMRKNNRLRHNRRAHA
ncbi:HNH endonuclease signature motif containing protein [Nocardia asiatica]|uniref:HNH endonuclease signature motif containing protein n=1 Tax=Nocardia asiatica TaxID=209252 RepID=UPI002457610B|nr:HNH endonuclease signature motif containing protein [Nocardia asiatica]